MKHSDLKVGNRYQLPHGTGVLLGYETFDQDGFTLPMVPEVHPNPHTRHIFLLDEGHTWQQGGYPYTFEPKKYCAWGKDIKEIK